MRLVGFGFCKASEGVSRTAIVLRQSDPFCGQSAELASYDYDASDGAVCFSGLGSRDLAHGVVEGQAENLGTEVDGIAGQIALWPTPIGVFDDQTGIVGIVALRPAGQTSKGSEEMAAVPS